MLKAVSNALWYPEQRHHHPKGEDDRSARPRRARTEANNEVVASYHAAGRYRDGQKVHRDHSKALRSHSSPTRSMTLTLNGQQLTSTAIPDLVEEINSY